MPECERCGKNCRQRRRYCVACEKVAVSEREECPACGRMTTDDERATEECCEAPIGSRKEEEWHGNGKDNEGTNRVLPR